MPTRLTEFRVESLFGLYDHRIPLNQSERITIVIGPNGRGKTICLKLIEALFNQNLSFFGDVVFSLIAFSFSTGEVISIVPEGADERKDGANLCFTLSGPQLEEVKWRPATASASIRRELRRYIPDHWQPRGADTWIDERDGEEITTKELLERHQIPPKMLQALQQDAPPSFALLVNSINCRLIETERLLVSSASTDNEREFRFGEVRRRPRSTKLAIQQKAQRLRTVIKDTLGTYANLSQSLDRTFPLRLFDAQGTATLSQDQLRDELKRLDGRREALMRAGILDADQSYVTMRSGRIETGVAMALETYVNDTKRKLAVFDNLLSRLDLFKDLVAKRFTDKTLQIDRENGFSFKSHTSAQVPLDRLSSGEQHQLILAFDLLFEVPENSLILIDEPELSLHVAWQKIFIESLAKIISLNGFDVLLATHSPAVVSRYFRLAVELGPVE